MIKTTIMFRTILFICIFFLNLTACFFGDDEKLKTIHLDYIAEQNIDLGELYSDDSKTIELQIENTGAANLDFNNHNKVISDKARAELSFSPQKFILISGEKKIVKIHIKTKKIPESSLESIKFSAEIQWNNSANIQKSTVFKASIIPRPQCDDNNPCTEDYFDGEKCVTNDLDDGTDCNDQNACTLNNKCVAGQCLGKPLECQDTQECTADRCDAAFGCISEEDHSLCASDDPCMDATCSADLGCQENPKEEGALCSFDGCAEIGLCFVGLCNKQQVPDGFPCDDGNSCSTDDMCQQGTCVSENELEFQPQASEILIRDEVQIDATEVIWPFDNYTTRAKHPFLRAFPEKILATAELEDGRFRVIWQTEFINQAYINRAAIVPGDKCDWREYRNESDVIRAAPNYDGPSTYIDPEGSALNPQYDIQCISGIFISDIMPNNEIVTHQIALSAGATAADIEINENGFGTENTAVVISAPGGRDIYTAHYKPLAENKFKAPSWNRQKVVHSYPYLLDDSGSIETHPSQIRELSITQHQEKVSILGHWQFIEDGWREHIRPLLEYGENSQNLPDSVAISSLNAIKSPMFLVHYESTSDFLNKISLFKNITLHQLGTFTLPPSPIINIDDIFVKSHQLSIAYDSKNTVSLDDDLLQIGVLAPEFMIVGHTPFSFSPFVRNIKLADIENHGDPSLQPVDFDIYMNKLLSSEDTNIVSQTPNSQLYAFDLSDLLHGVKVLQTSLRETLECDSCDQFPYSLSSLTMKYDSESEYLKVIQKFDLPAEVLFSAESFTQFSSFDNVPVGISLLQTKDQNYDVLQLKGQHHLLHYDNENSLQIQNLFKPIKQEWNRPTKNHKNGLNIVASIIDTEHRIYITEEHLGGPRLIIGNRPAIELQRFMCVEQNEEQECWSHNDCQNVGEMMACQVRGPRISETQDDIFTHEGKCIDYQECPIEDSENTWRDSGLHISQSPPQCPLNEQLYKDTINRSWVCGFAHCPTLNDPNGVSR